MRFFGFGDNSDFKCRVAADVKGRWHWIILDATGKARALPPLAGTPEGFESYAAAVADAREVVNGLGADFKDLDVESETADEAPGPRRSP